MKKLIFILFLFSIPILAQEPFWEPVFPQLENKNIKKIFFSYDNKYVFGLIDTSALIRYSLNDNSYDTIFNALWFPSQYISKFYYDNNKLYLKNKWSTIIYSTDNGTNWMDLIIPDHGYMLFVVRNKVFTTRWKQDPGPKPPPPYIYGIWTTDGTGENLTYFSCSRSEKISDIEGYYANRIYYRKDYPLDPTGIFSASFGQETGTLMSGLVNYFIDTTNGDYYYSLNSFLYKKTANTLVNYYIGNVNNMLFTNNKILAVSNSGFYYKPDYAQSFLRKSNGITGIGNFITLDNEGYIYLATTNGVYKSSSSINNLVSVESETHLPETFSLNQNYPNPFNPSTTIKFTLPEQNFVTIKVFDVLGREIKILLNEEKTSGSYEINFNAEGLTSGVYFYRIDAGNFSETKKMLLMK